MAVSAMDAEPANHNNHMRIKWYVMAIIVCAATMMSACLPVAQVDLVPTHPSVTQSPTATSTTISIELVDKYYSHFVKGNSYFETGKYMDALSEYTLSIAPFPTEWNGSWGMGMSKVMLGRCREALDNFGDLATAQNVPEKVYFYAGLARIAVNDLEGAFAILNRGWNAGDEASAGLAFLKRFTRTGNDSEERKYLDLEVARGLGWTDKDTKRVYTILDNCK